MLSFTSATAQADVDVEQGGRLASLRIDGRELLVQPEADPMRWGSYPMVPFAGRIRRGQFSMNGVTHELPRNLEPHAIHGYGYTSPWTVVDDTTIEWIFGPPWPFAGRARQRFALDDSSLRITMDVDAADAQPLMMGWHPWFRRDIGAGELLQLSFGPARMYELDAEAIPTGTLISPPPGPWDNCFTALAADPVLRWGSALTVRLSSSADHWVVYDEPTHAVCVEPQTDAPNAVNRGRTMVDAGTTTSIDLTLSWA
ncbi:MAG: aldose 1-epimerase [Actinomycetota bacterium]